MSDSNTLPKESQRRRAILVTSSDDRAKIKNTTEARARTFRNNEGVAIISVPCDTSDTIVQELDERSLLTPGNFLVQSPYNPNSYEEISNAPIEFALTKLLCLSQVCRLLGAVELTFLSVEAQSEQGETVAKAEVGSHGIKGKVEGSHSTLSRLARRIELSDKFITNGKLADVEAAMTHIRSYRLSSDPIFKSLIEAQTPGAAKLGERLLKMSLSREVSSAMKFAIGLEVPIYADVSSQIQRLKSESYEYLLSVRVAF